MNLLYVSGIVLLSASFVVKAEKGFCAEVIKNGEWQKHGDCDSQSQVLAEERKKFCWPLDGFLYNNICYWVVLGGNWEFDYANGDISLLQADLLCSESERTGVRAYPLNGEHYQMMAELVEKRTRIHPSLPCRIWTGLYFSYATKRVTLANGDDAPYSPMTGYIPDAAIRNVIMYAWKTDTGSIYYDMENARQTDSMPGVICQGPEIP